MKELWTDKHQPKTLDEFVFKDPGHRQKIEKWVNSGALSHVLLTGSPGTGKSSLIKLLMRLLDVNPYDFLEVNASKDNGVDFIRDTITKFAETMGYGEMRYILMDEADYLSVNAQAVLRNIMERYSGSVRFLLTANYPDKVIPAIKSRCETGRIHIDKLDPDAFTLRLANILIAEDVNVDEAAMGELMRVVDSTYPDMRRAISKIQANVNDGVLELEEEAASNDSDYKLEMVALFAAGKFREARTLVCTQATPEEYQDIYRFMYQNIAVWAGDDQDKQDRAILVIRDGLVKHTSCADIELNLAATFIELSMLAQE